MRKIITIAAALLLYQTQIWAQASNDDCITPIDLGVVPSCTPTTYTNVGATNSNIGLENNPTCFNGGIATRDVWFTFTAGATLIDVRLTLTGIGTSMVNPQIAIYRGDCTPDNLSEYDCVKADVGETELYIDLEGLTPNFTYFVRVSDYSLTGTPNAGEFTLCIDAIPPVFTIDEGGSTACSGTLSDTGGPDDDYGINENFTYTICPTQPSACINFTMDYFNIDPGSLTGPGSDVLTFYDGPNTNSPVLASLNGSGFSTADIDGGGGVCFNVKAKSGCLTVQFTSDAFLNFEGFLGTWECSNEPCPPAPVLAVNPLATATDIVNSVSTPATIVTVTDIKCDAVSRGTFSYPTATNDLQMAKGLVLSTGDVTDIPGFGGGFASTDTGPFMGDGDADLDYLSSLQLNGQESNDACVVELEVFVATNELTFEYVFASEEYPEYVNSPFGFNDIFAFFVSGPGIVGDPNIGNQKNIAVLPGTSTPVEINSVNNILNWEYYRNNENGNELVFDGLTSDFLGVKKSLTARTEVIPCNTYKLKLAVADRGDGSFDSGVFISEIKGGTPNIDVQFASGIDYFIETCSGIEDSLVISISLAQDAPISFVTTLGGTATLGVDYLLNLPPVVTIPAGATSVKFPIIPLTDALVEGTETITITLSNNFGCGNVIYGTLTVELEDNVIVDVNAGSDTLLVCANVAFQLQAAGATSYFWQPAGAVSNPNIDNPTITTNQNQWLTVTGSIATCTDIDSVYIQVVNPSIQLFALADTLICVGETVPLLAVNNVNNAGLLWSPVEGLSDPLSSTPIAAPSLTTTYTVSVEISGCLVADQVTIKVDTLFYPDLIGDTTVCQNYPVKLGTDIVGTTVYSWTPSAGLSADDVSGPIALPQATETYTLTATSANGYCTQSDVIKVTVIPSDVDIAGDPYREICLGTTVPLTATATPPSASQVTWSPSFYVTNPTGLTTSTTPDESVTIVATYNVSGCIAFDSVQIRVDSLPESFLSLRPFKEVYCPGDTVTLLSTTYEPANFPDIQFEWDPAGLGQVTPDSLWNLVIRAQKTSTYIRYIENRACRDTVSILVPVDSIPVITITSDKTSICPGETISLFATVIPNQALEWAMADGLSCTKCPNPTVQPTSTATYTVSTPDANCPASASIELKVNPVPVLNLESKTLCVSDLVNLNLAPGEPNTTYSWTSNPPGFTSSLAQPTATPTQTTTYTVVASNPTCSTQATTTITVLNATLEAGPNVTACAGVPVTLTAVVTGATGTFTWTTGTTNLTGQSITITPSQSAVYNLTFNYNNAQCQLEDNLLVNVNIVRIDSISVAPDTLCEGRPVAIRAFTSSTSTSPLTFQWQQDGANVAGATNNTFEASNLANDKEEGTTYNFSIVATDVNGCTDNGAVNVLVRRCFKIANAFTPDGDGTNEDFGVINLFDGRANVESFSIFNRWGQKVFSTTNPTERWDGTVDNKPAPVDVYLYQISIRNPDGTSDTFTGEVTLLR